MKYSEAEWAKHAILSIDRVKRPTDVGHYKFRIKKHIYILLSVRFFGWNWCARLIRILFSWKDTGNRSRFSVIKLWVFRFIFERDATTVPSSATAGCGLHSVKYFHFHRFWVFFSSSRSCMLLGFDDDFPMKNVFTKNECKPLWLIVCALPDLPSYYLVCAPHHWLDLMANK